MVAAVVLAAGASSRFGSSPPKQAVFLPEVLRAPAGRRGRSRTWSSSSGRTRSRRTPAPCGATTGSAGQARRCGAGWRRSEPGSRPRSSSSPTARSWRPRRSSAWQRRGGTGGGDVVAASYAGIRGHPVLLARAAWESCPTRARARSSRCSSRATTSALQGTWTTADREEGYRWSRTPEAVPRDRARPPPRTSPRRRAARACPSRAAADPRGGGEAFRPPGRAGRVAGGGPRLPVRERGRGPDDAARVRVGAGRRPPRGAGAGRPAGAAEAASSRRTRVRLLGLIAIAAAAAAFAAFLSLPGPGGGSEQAAFQEAAAKLPPAWKIQVEVLNGGGDINWTRQVASKIGAMAYTIDHVAAPTASTTRRPRSTSSPAAASGRPARAQRRARPVRSPAAAVPTRASASGSRAPPGPPTPSSSARLARRPSTGARAGGAPACGEP